HPAAADEDVLVHLADDGKARQSYAEVQRGRRSTPLAGDDAQRQPFGEPLQYRRRSIAAAIVDDEDFRRSAVGLGGNCCQRVFNPRSAVVNGHDEADTFHEARPSMSAYSASTRAHTTSSPKAARMRGAAAAAAARHAH